MNGPCTRLTESTAARLFVPASTKIVGPVGVGVGVGVGVAVGVGVGVGVGAAVLTVIQAENSDVFPCASVAVQLMMPPLIPEGKSKGKLNCASPLLLVVTLGTLPDTSGRLAAWLVVHCPSGLK